MEVIILTGMSGSGKSVVADYLEDMGFFCVDNIPPQILANLVRTFMHGQGGEGYGIKQLAFVIDVRSAEFFSGLEEALNELDELEIRCRVIFLDAKDEVLVSRYRQTRRNHPMGSNLPLSKAIAAERMLLAPILERADDYIDSSSFTLPQMRDYIYNLVGKYESIEQRLSILITSFGFKYGIPEDCDLIEDVRFVPNPYYDEELRELSGLDPAVRAKVLDDAVTQGYLQRLLDLLLYLMPHYVKEGKVRLTIGMGCTGGRHRSVAIAKALGERLREANLRVVVVHRDIGRDLLSQN